MWSQDQAPTLSLPDLAKTLGMSFRATKQMVEDTWNAKRVQAEKMEMRAAVMRAKQGPRKVNEELEDMVPAYSMSRLRWLELYRASLMEKGCKGGELLNDDDFSKWLLKKLDWLRIEIAKAQNRVGWLPTVERAKEWGNKERAGKAVLDPTTGGWMP